MENYIKNLIGQGEHQQLDFKFEISDSKKIARSMVAFANTDGGTLLVGVKDNGKIAGVRTEEEYYMIESAAELFCKPPVSFKAKTWPVEGKTVLEVTIPKSKDTCHSAPDPNNKWMVYVRSGDQNRLANTVFLKLWARHQKSKGTFIRFTHNEKMLLDYLKNNKSISLGQLRKLTGLSRYHAENLLVNLLSIRVLQLEFTEKGAIYKLVMENMAKTPSLNGFS
jgi:predicted HTH transcriptional regulator